MPSDNDLREKRSPEELRYLRDHVAALRGDPEVQAAFDAYDREEPTFTLEAFQNGVLIDGAPCRLTVGTLALLRATRSRCLGYGEDAGPIRIEDITLAMFLLCDDTRNVAVSVADDPDELAAALAKYGRTINVKRCAVELFEFLRRSGAALRTDDTQEENVFRAADDSWADDVDLLAHEYGWSDEYILWEIPLVRISRLKESIVARRKGEPRRSRRDKGGIALLDAIEKKGQELRSDGK